MIARHIELPLLKVVVGFAALATLISASAVIISPVELNISSKNPVTSFKVTNDSSAAITYQSNVLLWEQIGGLEKQGETKDLVITPPIVTVQPKATQIFRVAMLRVIPHSREQAYRVLIEDISDEKIANSEQGVSFKFNHDLPLFYTPLNIVSSLTWSSCVSSVVGKGCLRLENKGNSRLKIIKISALSKNNGEVIGSVKTILSGGSYDWSYASMQSSEAIEGFRIITSKEPINISLKDFPGRK